MLNAITLMMFVSLWRTTHATCRPSFVSLHRQASDHIRALSLTPSTDALSPGSRYASCRKSYLPAHNSLFNGRIKSHTFLRLSDPFTTANTGTASFATDANELKPFTWDNLIDLFRKNQEDNYIPSDHPNLRLFRRSSAAQASYEKHKKYLDSYWMSAYDYLVISKFGEWFGFEKVIVNTDGPENSNIFKPIEDDTNQRNNTNYCIPPKGCVFKASPSLTQASKYTIENEMTYLRLVLNDFPYDVDEGIEHWCLWKIGDGDTSSAERVSGEEMAWALKELKNLQADENNSGSGGIIERDGSNILFDAMPHSYQAQQSVPIVDTFYWVNPPHLQSMPEIHHAHILVLRSDKKSNDEHFA